MNTIAKLHEKRVHGRRVDSLLRNLKGLIPENSSVLDVGCGDGLLASLIQEQVPGSSLQGIDVLIRPDTKIPIAEFDGITIPMEDNSVDVVMMVDVLHHTDDPEIMVREAKRVARKWFVIKDHTRNGLLAYSTLRFMDWVGNAHHGVALPYNYLSKQEWLSLFERNQMEIETWNPKLDIYGMPGDLLFGRALHFCARLNVGS
jgi:ubiquinone/menaquinone biosynthesis C-methylase UbiE